MAGSADLDRAEVCVPLPHHHKMHHRPAFRIGRFDFFAGGEGADLVSCVGDQACSLQDSPLFQLQEQHSHLCCRVGLST